MKYLFRGEKSGEYYYGNLLVMSGNTFIVNDRQNMPVCNVCFASPFKYTTGEYIFEKDKVLYTITNRTGIVKFQNGSFIVVFDNAEILLSEIYNYLEKI